MNKRLVTMTDWNIKINHPEKDGHLPFETVNPERELTLSFQIHPNTYFEHFTEEDKIRKRVEKAITKAFRLFKNPLSENKERTAALVTVIEGFGCLKKSFIVVTEKSKIEKYKRLLKTSKSNVLSIEMFELKED